MKLFLKSNYFVFKLIRLPLISLGYFQWKINGKPDTYWSDRIQMVIDAPDNKFIDRVSNAGEVISDYQIMHNGIKIHVGSYYGDGNTILLHRNKGVHEPQEEKVFEEILEFLPHNATMLELGSFWAFYSMTFQQKFRNGVNYLIEPDAHALLSGKHNFRLNGFRGHFFKYMITDFAGVGEISVDQFLQSNKIDRLHILHSDIQGFELKMLDGAIGSLREGRIDFIFISTHSNELHYACIKYLTDLRYEILCEANLDETFSWDGLIVAKHGAIKEPTVLKISKR